MDDETERFMEGVVGVVVATNYEMHALWAENERRAPERKLAWSGNTQPGVGVEFGKLAKMPVCGTLWPKLIGGHKILFVELTSRVVDHRIVDAWLQDHLPVTAFEDGDPRKRINASDPSNFTNVLSEPRRRVERAASKESAQ